jgi:hypothetical protein
MFDRLSSLAVLVTLVGSLLAIPAADALAQSSNPNRNRLDVPVSGVVQNVGTFAGTFGVSRFAMQDGQLMAIGQLTGTVTNAVTGATQTIVSNIAMPVASATGSCEILNLVLGPLHLDLLGLVIDLNQVVLTITGTTGAGDLLGNLLCAIAGLLDAGSLGTQLVNLLNQLLGVLAGL